MPDIITHSKVTAPIVSGSVLPLMGMLFDVDSSLLWIAFIGAWVGLAISPSNYPTDIKKLEALKRFVKTTITVIIVTICAGYAIPYLLSIAPNVAQKTIAFASGIVLMLIKDEVHGWFKVASIGIKDLIARLLGGVGK